MHRLARALGALVVVVGGLSGIATRPAAAVVTPAMRVGEVSVWEGDAGFLQVSVPVDLSVPTTVPVSVRFSVTSTDADASDFVARTGTLRFAAGVTTGKINVKVLADTVQEPEEHIAVSLSSPVGATIDDGSGSITIRDDDAPGDPNHLDVTIGDVTVEEADGGRHYVYVPVTLSAPAPQTIRVTAGTTTDTCADAAVAGQDYLGAFSQKLSFAAGVRAKQLKFTIIGDATPEAVERIRESVHVTLGPAVVREADGGVEIIDDPDTTLPQASTTGIERVSVATDGSEAYSPVELHGCLLIAAGSDALDLSTDGRYVLFWSAADNLVPGDTNGVTDLFVRDTVAGTTERVSVGTGGTQSSVGNGSGAMSADGRYVLFPSHDPGLVPAGSPDTQLFVHDRVTDVTQLVSVTTAGTTVPGGSYIGDISDDGRVVAFRSDGATPATYVRDLVAGTTQYLASTPSGLPHLSANGRFVSFVSADTTLVPGDTNNFPDVFVRDRTTGTTERVNVTTSGAQEVTTPASDGSWIGRMNLSDPRISPDGRYVVFASYVSNLSSAFAPMVRDRALHTTSSVTVPLTPPTGGACYDSAPSISDNGRFVALQVACTGPNGSYTVNGASRGIYVVDRQLGTYRRADVLNDGTVSDADPAWGFNAWISGDGKWIAFGSYADNLVDNDYNGQRDVFLAPAD